MENKNDKIYLENTISVVQIRHLLEVTNTLAKALTEDEFLFLMKFYGQVTDRILKVN